MTTMRMLDLSVPAPSHGERLDRFLAAAQADLSRSRLQQLIRGGRVSVNGRAARASHRHTRWRSHSHRVARVASRATLPEELPLTIVHEDDDLIVIDKPAGTVVHPGAGVMSGTLVHALLHRYPEIRGCRRRRSSRIVNRLDKDTSGLIAVARSARAYRALVEALRARTVHRRYRALVWGDPRSEGGTISAAVGRDPHERKRMAVVARGGREARTHWRVDRALRARFHLELELDTGLPSNPRSSDPSRHPVVGDPVYGGRGKKLLSLPPLQRSLGRAHARVLTATSFSSVATRAPAPGEPEQDLPSERRCLTISRER
jgi:23S rRNA pseudouridine1911/1915/1917 synthase